jgi:hypothetical protein
MEVAKRSATTMSSSWSSPPSPKALRTVPFSEVPRSSSTIRFRPSFRFFSMPAEIVSCSGSKDTNQWNWFVPPVSGTPPQARAYHAAVICEGKLIVIGGDSSTQVFSDVHCLDLTSWEWSKESLHGDSLQPCCGHTAEVVGGGHIVLFGGWGLRGKHKDGRAVQVINTETWECRTLVPDGGPPVRCAGHTMAVLRDESGSVGAGAQLLLFGGQDEEERPLGQTLLLKGQLRLL